MAINWTVFDDGTALSFPDVWSMQIAPSSSGVWKRRWRLPHNGDVLSKFKQIFVDY
jgi:hypothetical protein